MPENEFGPSANEGTAAGPASDATAGRVSRRRLLAASGAGAAAVGLSNALPSLASAASRNPRRTGTIRDLKHIVILMQENRSWDHYFGALDLPGSRGFGDKQVLTWQDGRTIYYDPNSRAEGYLIPYHADSLKYNAQNASSRNWYFKEQDVPWHHAIAKAWTVGDHYFCSLDTSTSPNRIMMWSGTNDPTGALGGPVINNNGDYGYAYKWKTYPETLQDAGVSWQIYVNNDTDDNFLGDYTDNTVRSFAAFNPANATPENSEPGEGLLARGNVLNTHTTPPAGVANDTSNIDYVLKDFIGDCAAGTIPEVSWIVAPAAWTEHPTYAPNNGAVYIDRVVKAVHDNPELWDSTLIILNYDEPDHANRIGEGGFFDHVIPPIPEVGTTGERAPGIYSGCGGRVPFVLISPWTRGGWVCSEVFDATSTIQLIEEWTTSMGKPALCENISDWRRSVAGNLLAAIDFSHFDNSFPTLPAPAALLQSVVADRSLPPVPQPAIGAQVLPTQPSTGPVKARKLPYSAHGSLVVDRDSGTATVKLSYSGGTKGKAISLVGLADKYVPALTGAEPLGLGQDALPITVSNTQSKSYIWDATQTGGKYALSFYGPDHFIRSFAGTISHPGQNVGPVPSADAELITGYDKQLKITLSNAGLKPVRFTLTRNDYDGKTQSVVVSNHRPVVVHWPADVNGYYDVIITTDSTDDFKHRYAGRIG